MDSDFVLAGRSRSSRMYDSGPRVFTGRKGSLLVTRPALSNLIPLVPCNQVTPFRGKGLNGQSVAIKTAATATTQKAFVLFRCAGAAKSSFTGRTCTSNLSRGSKFFIYFVLSCFVRQIEALDQGHFISTVGLRVLDRDHTDSRANEN